MDRLIDKYGLWVIVLLTILYVALKVYAIVGGE